MSILWTENEPWPSVLLDWKMESEKLQKKFFLWNQRALSKKEKKHRKIEKGGLVRLTMTRVSLSPDFFWRNFWAKSWWEVEWNETKKRSRLVFCDSKNLFRINQKVSGTLNRIWQKNLNSARSEFYKKPSKFDLGYQKIKQTINIIA